MIMKKAISYQSVAIVACVLMSGCTLSGLSGSSEFACKAPDGVTCQSVSTTYHQALNKQLPGQNEGGISRSSSTSKRQETGVVGGSDPRHRPTPTLIPISAVGGQQQAAIYSEPTIMRLWVAPWRDHDNDMHDQSYVYIRVNDGEWLVDSVRSQINRAYAPSFPGASQAVVAPKAATPQSNQQAAPQAVPASLTKALNFGQTRPGSPVINTVAETKAAIAADKEAASND